MLPSTVSLAEVTRSEDLGEATERKVDEATDCGPNLKSNGATP